MIDRQRNRCLHMGCGEPLATLLLKKHEVNNALRLNAAVSASNQHEPLKNNLPKTDIS